MESDKALKAKADDLEKKLQEKEKELKKGIVPPITEPSAFSIVQALEKVSLKELELTGLKHQNKNLEGLAVERERERKDWEVKRVELQAKNEKLI